MLLGCLAGQMPRGDRATSGLFAATAAWMCLAKSAGMPGAATSGVVIAWAAAASRWDSGAVENADKRLKSIWTYAEPMLFGLIGAAIDLRSFSIHTLALAFATVAGSITIKLCATYLVTTARGFTSWECEFAAGVWTGKASIQVNITNFECKLPSKLFYFNLTHISFIQAALSTVPLAIIAKYHLAGTLEAAHAHTAFATLVAGILLGAPLASAWAGIYRKVPGSFGFSYRSII
ncbi:hypothetical protein HDU87_008320 [Geranomyces variabilis]|uniref:Cation/H+ exchanger domain-containing protein n=1 Tax=Geranomyces variabilis TaxID=109894 RepID=A0AAD5XM77_9FUNG|nr:hypothetical protein HDU87_008320 [Geranomyces variabilis]